MADLKPISQFATASSVEANTLLFVSTPNQNNGYDSEKVSASELGEALVNDFEYTQDLSTVSKKVTGAINEHQSVIGYTYDEYDATTAYSKDDLCIYNNVLYKALQATTGNLPTNTTYWEQTSIADEIGRIDTALSGITLNSNPATGDYHFDLAQGWSVTNFVFNRVGNRIYIQGVFEKNAAFDPYEAFISLSSSSTKIISPYYETWFAVMCDNGSGANMSTERLQAVNRSLRIASGNTSARRIFVAVSWISSSSEV